MENIIKDDLSLASDLRIQKLIDEADNEINKIQPEIDYLENCLTKLEELKTKKAKLLTLKGSLISVLHQKNVNNINIINADLDARIHPVKSQSIEKHNINATQQNITNLTAIFNPEYALAQARQFIRPNKNLNYEIFKAIVYNGGEASTEQIKEYLVKNKIKQPKTGKPFDDVELKDISSRVNYLTRKKLIVSMAHGIFKSLLGYQ